MIGNPEQLVEKIAAEWFYQPLSGYGCFRNDCDRVGIEVAAAHILARLARDRGYWRTEAAAQHRAEFALLLYAEFKKPRDVVPVIRDGVAYDDLPIGALYVAAARDGAFKLHRKADWRERLASR